MKAIAVMPTIQRKEVGWRYSNRCLKINEWFVEDSRLFSYFFIYCKPQDRARFANRQIIEMIEHKENKHIPGSYAFWRTNLCLDFMYSMEMLSKLGEEYILWMEDDAIIYRGCKKVIKGHMKEKTNLCILSQGTTVVLVRCEFIERMIELMMKQSVLSEDVPLDWALKRMSKVQDGIVVEPTVNGHMGKVSSSETDAWVLGLAGGKTGYINKRTNQFIRKDWSRREEERFIGATYKKREINEEDMPSDLKKFFY